MAVPLREIRGLSPADTNEDEKRGLVRALGNRIIYGISRVSTLTPHALLSAALLAHRGRGVSAAELSRRIGALLRIAEEEGRPISSLLSGAPLSPTTAGLGRYTQRRDRRRRLQSQRRARLPSFLLIRTVRI